jgi:hypothetical protein
MFRSRFVAAMRMDDRAFLHGVMHMFCLGLLFCSAGRDSSLAWCAAAAAVLFRVQFRSACVACKLHPLFPSPASKLGTWSIGNCLCDRQLLLGSSDMRCSRQSNHAAAKHGLHNVISALPSSHFGVDKLAHTSELLAKCIGHGCRRRWMDSWMDSI